MLHKVCTFLRKRVSPFWTHQLAVAVSSFSINRCYQAIQPVLGLVISQKIFSAISSVLLWAEFPDTFVFPPHVLRLLHGAITKTPVLCQEGDKESWK